MRARVLVAWIVAAVLGLALAAGITLAASQLSSQRVGLSGEPLSAGDELVPRAAPRPAAVKPADDRTVTGAQPARRGDSHGSEEHREAPDGDDD